MDKPKSILRATIVGAGMSGSVMAAFLARRGHQVTLYERRGDIRAGLQSAGRSLNLTLSERGLAVLRELEVEDQIEALCVPVLGRRIHDLNGRIKFFPYGNKPHEILHAIKRNDLNRALLEAADEYPNVTVHFEKKFLHLDRETGTAYFRDEGSGEETAVESDLLIGADGSFSKVRISMQRGERADYSREFLDWDYKELPIPPSEDGGYRMEPNALHAWPRGDCMLMALPNQDGSFNCICSMPGSGPAPSFESFRTPQDVMGFFNRLFPDAVPLIPDLAETFLERQTSAFLTIRTNRWSHGDRLVLIGDACHTAVPFYGQGMISALEDCTVLDQCLERHGTDPAAAFAEYQRLRKPHTDALATISVDNFVELRDSIRKPRVVARKKSEDWIGRRLPRFWIPLYTLIAHSRIPCADALAIYRRQRKIARFFGFDLIVALRAAGIWLTGAARRWLGRRRSEGFPFAAAKEPGEAGRAPAPEAPASVQPLVEQPGRRSQADGEEERQGRELRPQVPQRRPPQHDRPADADVVGQG